MEKKLVFSLPLKVVGIPLQLFCWFVVLVNAIFGLPFASFLIGGLSISLVPPAAIFLAGNGILGAIFKRSIFPVPEPDICCDTCKSKNVEITKHEVRFYCNDCKKEYLFNAKRGK
ncbi:MAG: hypothetical protein V1676_00095 [Candidatus Diapherotrites archaeon]